MPAVTLRLPRPIRTLGRYCLEAYWRTMAAPGQFSDWWADRRNRHNYPVLVEADLRRARKSDTVFICGTGASILSIAPGEWQRMAQHDIFSFRDFPRQTFVKADYHVTGEIDDADIYAAAINTNPRYDRTLFMVQEGFTAHMGNRLIGRLKLRKGAPVFRYRRRGRGQSIPFSRSFADGVVHGHGSVVGMVNIAYLLGWKRIVLVGIDLYDHRYFYMPPGETREVEKSGLTSSDPFIAGSSIVDQIGMWADMMRREGVQVVAYNPRSLLTSRIPIFQWSDAVSADGNSQGEST
ncbi:MAG: hypothetical protein Q8M24_08855 [Pseudolabrys sp.]|nr:hypothetical protein [Pseudolabrys sp.]MDP2295556.1 hypothetical protein [Pseudolabrys sp.]